MTYPEKIVVDELRAEFHISARKAKKIVDSYKKQDRYAELCECVGLMQDRRNKRDVPILRPFYE